MTVITSASVQYQEGEEIPWFFLDMDGTFYRWQIILSWIETVGRMYPHIEVLWNEAKPLLHQYRARAESFKAFSDYIIEKFWTQKAYIGISVDDAREAGRIVQRENDWRIYAITRALLQVTQAHGWGSAVISGSPQEALEEFMAPWNVTAIVGTQHPVDAQGVYCAGVIRHPVEDKGSAIDMLAAQYPISLDRSIAVGDSLLDKKMLEKVGHPLAVNPNPELLDEARRRRWPYAVESRGVFHWIQAGREVEFGTGLPLAIAAGAREMLFQRQE
ncbi:MAG: hypothetical protein RL141_887 [Candidatus Parcubacteria bacterium]